MMTQMLLMFLLVSSLASVLSLSRDFRPNLKSCSEKFNQLSFSGGGSFGAVEIGILKRIFQRPTIYIVECLIYNSTP